MKEPALCAYGTRGAHEGACALRLRYHKKSLTERYCVDMHANHWICPQILTELTQNDEET